MNKEKLKALIAETEKDFITIYTRPSTTEQDRRKLTTSPWHG